jgi:hypothetical protein
MKQRLGALITELVAAVRFGRCNARRQYFEWMLLADTVL